MILLLETLYKIFSNIIICFEIKTEMGGKIGKLKTLFFFF